ncbi:MAG TPA: DinB family protein [Gemmatimonadales bacterium]|nr:DinB family protein [Gemmatimonadales bacterium]
MPARWFERHFEFDSPNELFPNVVERVRGTPARVEERVRGVATATLTRRLGETWSIQENVGHLLDLEPLWLTRGRELATGAEVLTAADIGNRKTHQANHNAFPLASLLEAFRRERGRFVSLLDNADAALLERTALHPRLQTPMRLIDLALFVAEHDDHHLARIGELLSAG